ncbi:hypothetical protein [Hymenobacter edaphi]|uniref:hypothetical protein n=1 Tax=Hymenobacter edaphi TaxID=2211146 RepID=UPI0010577231|nr:hypothetical protein [Hymenobacter edaphi]
MSLQFDLGKFQKLFPNAQVSSNKVEYTIQDSDYRVYNPTWNGNKTELSMQIDHIRNNATDDHANLVLTFNPDGTLQQVAGDWEAGGDGFKIPPVVVLAVDSAAAVIVAGAAVAAPETAGLSAAVGLVVTAAAVAFDVYSALFNYISPKLIKLSDDGGRLYTTAVVCHAVNRACSCVSA